MDLFCQKRTLSTKTNLNIEEGLGRLMERIRTYCMVSGLVLVLALCGPGQGLAQEMDTTVTPVVIDPEQVVTIDRITLRGNKRTRVGSRIANTVDRFWRLVPRSCCEARCRTRHRR